MSNVHTYVVYDIPYSQDVFWYFLVDYFVSVLLVRRLVAILETAGYIRY
mgnify:CR=1 FL=1